MTSIRSALPPVGRPSPSLRRSLRLPRNRFATLGGLDETIELLATSGVRLRIDPVIEPLGCGFAASLGRYLEVRRRYPDAEMLMGVGNLTELTEEVRQASRARPTR